MHLSHWIWVCFFVGQLLNILKHAELAAASPLNGIRSIRHYLTVNLVAISVRVFAAAMLLVTWATHPDLLGAAQIPLTVGTAGLGGLFADFALDFVAAKFGVQKEIPPLKPADQPPPQGT